MDSILIVKSKADDLIKSGKIPEAVNLYTSWLKDKSLRPGSISSLILMKQKDHYAIIALAYNNRGHAKYLNVDFDGALIAYNEGLKYDPKLPVLYYNRGTIMYRMGYFDKAVVDMLVAVRLEPGCKEFHVALQKVLDQVQKEQH